jgi:hypothetical protein
MTTQLVIRGAFIVHATESRVGQSSKLGLYKYDQGAVDAGADLASLVSGAEIPVGNAANSTETVLTSVAFTPPSAGVYTLAVYFNNTTNAEMSVEYHGQVYVRWI